MAKAAKPVSANNKHLTKKEISARTAKEQSLKNNPITVPEELTGTQRAIAQHIIDELDPSKILCSLDRYVLSIAAASIDSLQRINKIINAEPNGYIDKNLLIPKEKHEKTFFRCCQELCLSPQSRAKISAAAAALQDDSTQALMSILSSVEDDE